MAGKEGSSHRDFALKRGNPGERGVHAPCDHDESSTLHIREQFRRHLTSPCFPSCFLSLSFNALFVSRCHIVLRRESQCDSDERSVASHCEGTSGAGEWRREARIAREGERESRTHIQRTGTCASRTSFNCLLPLLATSRYLLLCKSEERASECVCVSVRVSECERVSLRGSRRESSLAASLASSHPSTDS